jgi:uncharacterized protein (TIGR03083 family)
MSAEFASWVVPTADRFRTTRREIAELARRIPNKKWEAESPLPGWRFRDVLAHLAEGDGFCRRVIKSVADGVDTDMRAYSGGREERIANALERGAPLTIEQLIARVVDEGEETQRVLTQLGEADEEVMVITSRTNPEPRTIRDFLDGYRHDEEHIEHLKPALAMSEVTSE